MRLSFPELARRVSIASQPVFGVDDPVGLDDDERVGRRHVDGARPLHMIRLMEMRGSAAMLRIFGEVGEAVNMTAKSRCGQRTGVAGGPRGPVVARTHMVCEDRRFKTRSSRRSRSSGLSGAGPDNQGLLVPALGVQSEAVPWIH